MSLRDFVKFGTRDEWIGEILFVWLPFDVKKACISKHGDWYIFCILSVVPKHLLYLSCLCSHVQRRQHSFTFISRHLRPEQTRSLHISVAQIFYPIALSRGVDPYDPGVRTT
jgi:hypothetical protein